MDNPLYHVLLEGRRIGPYDRRTIVGMRVRKTLTSKQLLVGADGVQLTVGQLLAELPPTAAASPVAALPAAQPQQEVGEASRSGSHSVVRALHAATLVEVEGSGHAIPPFKGELEVRVQTKVLRVSGRFRQGRGWVEDRVKFPLRDIVHARLRGSIVDLWVRPPAQPGLQRVTLDLGSREAAGELAECLPHAAPWPGSEPLAARPAAVVGVHPLLWAAVAAAAVVAFAVLAWALTRPL